MTDKIETYEVRAVAKALMDAAYAIRRDPDYERFHEQVGPFSMTRVETARAILTALKLAQARAEKRAIKENHRWFAEHAAKYEARWARREESRRQADIKCRWAARKRARASDHSEQSQRHADA